MLRKIRFIEPGNYSPYRPSPLNALVYNKYLRNPSTGMITLATIAKQLVPDTLMYSEALSEVRFEDVCDADIVFFGINTFNAVRGYELARKVRARSSALLVFGGLHASLNPAEALEVCDYVLTGDADESIVDFLRAIDANRPVDFPGVVFKQDGAVKMTGPRAQPENIDTVPDRSLVFEYARLAKRYDTLWPQVHASRGCPHSCAYCSVIEHFGRKVRKRSPESVVADIRAAIEFHRRPIVPRLNTVLWITDDNFAADRQWAVSVLKAIIESGIRYHFTVQARFEIGFDDELLGLMKKAGFIEVALGIEFVTDESFKTYRKKSTRDGIVRAIANIRRHGIGVRGLFIVGAPGDEVGIGDEIARFVEENGIHGALVQSMFFTPGTEFFRANEAKLLHRDWDRYDGNVVHWPERLLPHELQQEIIRASARIYSVPRLLRALLTNRVHRGVLKVLFLGEFLWQASLRRDLAKDLPYLRRAKKPEPRCAAATRSEPMEGTA